MQKSQLKLMGAVAAVAVIAGGGVGVWAVTKDDSPRGVLLSAEEGVAARAQRDQMVPAEATVGNEGGAAATGSKMAADSIAIDCGNGAEPYVPTEEELASANADTQALRAVLDTYGIAYTATTDPSGYEYVETDYDDIVAQSVVSSFWDTRYPAIPPTQAELDDVVKSNDVIAAHLDAAGVAYTRTTDDAGWESLDYDYNDIAAQDAVNAAYAELYPPVPPTAEELATMTADNDKLAAAFKAAGIPFTRTSDELGWEWIDWDYEDADITAKVDAVFAELYPVEPGEGCVMPLDDMSMDDTATQNDTVQNDSVTEEGSIEAEAAPEEIAPAEGDAISPDNGEFTAEEIVQRDAEAIALASGLEAAGVTVRTEGESPWQVVLFDVNNDAAVPVVASVLAGRG